MGGSNWAEPRAAAKWRSPRLEYAELPNAALAGGIGGPPEHRLPDDPHPKSPDRTLHPRRPPQQNRRRTEPQKPRLSRQGVPGAGPRARQAAALRRRPCRENAGSNQPKPEQNQYPAQGIGPAVRRSNIKRMNEKVRSMTRMAACTAVLCVLSQISFPLPSGVPVTLQTLGMALCGCLLGYAGALSAWRCTCCWAWRASRVRRVYRRGEQAGRSTGGFLIGFIFWRRCAAWPCPLAVYGPGSPPVPRSRGHPVRPAGRAEPDRILPGGEPTLYREGRPVFGRRPFIGRRNRQALGPHRLNCA